MICRVDRRRQGANLAAFAAKQNLDSRSRLIGCLEIDRGGSRSSIMDEVLTGRLLPMWCASDLNRGFPAEVAESPASFRILTDPDHAC